MIITVSNSSRQGSMSVFLFCPNELDTGSTRYVECVLRVIRRRRRAAALVSTASLFLLVSSFQRPPTSLRWPRPRLFPQDYSETPLSSRRATCWIELLSRLDRLRAICVARGKGRFSTTTVQGRTRKCESENGLDVLVKLNRSLTVLTLGKKGGTQRGRSG